MFVRLRISVFSVVTYFLTLFVHTYMANKHQYSI